MSQAVMAGSKMEALKRAMRDAKDPFTFFILALLTKIVVALFFRKVVVSGLSKLPSGPFICIANHSSRWDGPLLGRLINRPANFMVSPNELNGLQGALLKKVGAFPAHPRLDFVGHVLKQFAKGEPFVIFPEGNVHYDGFTHSFKRGVARVAFAAWQAGFDVPIVPVAIRYDFKKRLAYYNFGLPLTLQEYKAAYLEAPNQAIKDLTSSLEREVRYLSAELGNKNDARLLEEESARTDEILKEKFELDFNMASVAPTDQAQDAATPAESRGRIGESRLTSVLRQCNG